MDPLFFLKLKPKLLFLIFGLELNSNSFQLFWLDNDILFQLILFVLLSSAAVHSVHDFYIVKTKVRDQPQWASTCTDSTLMGTDWLRPPV